MDSRQIQASAKKYKQISLWITTGLTIAILMYCSVSYAGAEIMTDVIKTLVVSALFSLIASTAYGEAWKGVAMRSPINLTKFYLVASALKMMFGIVAFLIGVLVVEKAHIVGYALIFMLFYIILLAFDCIYFARTEKKYKIEK